MVTKLSNIIAVKFSYIPFFPQRVAFLIIGLKISFLYNITKPYLLLLFFLFCTSSYTTWQAHLNFPSREPRWGLSHCYLMKLKEHHSVIISRDSSTELTQWYLHSSRFKFLPVELCSFLNTLCTFYAPNFIRVPSLYFSIYCNSIILHSYTKPYVTGIKYPILLASVCWHFY